MYEVLVDVGEKCCIVYCLVIVGVLIGAVAVVQKHQIQIAVMA